MIELPVWLVVLVLLGLFPAVGLWAYWFGWSWRERHQKPFTYVNKTNMTPEQEAAFKSAFSKLDGAFDDLNKVFDAKQ